MIVHLCCSVDAGYYLKRLKSDFPDEKIVGFFYDPNIHPYSEYYLRMIDSKRICQKLDIEFIEGNYDYEYWLESTKTLSDEPEKGHRCSVCFDISLEESAKVAQNLGHKSISTSLLMSPMKSPEQLEIIGKVVKRKYDINFILKDYRSKGGHQKQQEMAKEYQTYRQDYCGCMYALIDQREDEDEKKDVIDELFSPITNQVLPASIEERTKTYLKRVELENNNREYKIIKENFLNYRLFSGSVKVSKKIVPSYILYYSMLNRDNGGRVEFEKDGVHHLNRMQIKFITLEKFNKLLDKNYKNIYEIIKNPPKIENELRIRKEITNSEYDLSPIIVLEKIEDKRIDVSINAKTYLDNKEVILLK
jgi:predicted adenine nucleotide alpha hydrolase (AANH) superfamily ATPase